MSTSMDHNVDKSHNSDPKANCLHLMLKRCLAGETIFYKCPVCGKNFTPPPPLRIKAIPGPEISRQTLADLSERNKIQANTILELQATITKLRGEGSGT